VVIRALYDETVPAFDPLSRLLGALAFLLGTAAATVYWRAGLSLSHYDAKAHLVVARRILDSLTPSWEQIGAVWLPLPHLLNALPVQIDWMYRTGASGIALSIVSFAVTAACLSAIVMRISGSPAGAILAASLFATNPSVLYLQSTPMTEPLLFGLSALVVLHLAEWATSDVPRIRAAAGWIILAACLTRYEAWPVVAAAMGLAAIVKWRRGAAARDVARETARLALYPAGALVLFIGMSFASTGEWFVTGGFYVPDPKLQGQPAAALEAIRDGLADLAGPWFVRFSLIGTGLLVLAATVGRSRSGLVLPLALLGSIALPFYAYYSGHPFRIRYEVPLILAGAACCGAAVSLLGRAAPVAAIPMVALVMVQAPSFDAELAPMVVEAQLDRANGIGRRAVTACLVRDYDGTTIMASMGSLAHYMQELSHAGFDLDDFLHEGSGPMWQYALYVDPSLVAGWILIEEAAEGGDELHRRRQWWPRFQERYDRVCEGGNVALYRRKPRAQAPSP
jgi:hypothetical protein